MARTTKAAPAYEDPNEIIESETPRSTRRRLQVRRPEEMAGLTVSILVPKVYEKALMQAYFEDENAVRQGRKLPEATMVRRLVIKGLAELTGDSEDEVTQAMAEAEAEEADSIRRHRERHEL